MGPIKSHRKFGRINAKIWREIYVDSAMENLSRFRMNQEKKGEKSSYFLSKFWSQGVNQWQRELTLVRRRPPAPAGSPALDLDSPRNRNSWPHQERRGGGGREPPACRSRRKDLRVDRRRGAGTGTQGRSCGGWARGGCSRRGKSARTATSSRRPRPLASPCRRRTAPPPRPPRPAAPPPPIWPPAAPSILRSPARETDPRPSPDRGGGGPRGSGTRCGLPRSNVGLAPPRIRWGRAGRLRRKTTAAASGAPAARTGGSSTAGKHQLHHRDRRSPCRPTFPEETTTTTNLLRLLLPLPFLPRRRSGEEEEDGSCRPSCFTPFSRFFILPLGVNLPPCAR